MPITGFDFPGVTFEQTYAETSASTVRTLGVACVGPQFKLHRADNSADSKIATSADYSPSSGLTVQSLPGRTAGATLDTVTSAQHLVVKDGIFRYYNDTTSAHWSVSGGTITFTYAVKDGGGFTAASSFGTRGAQVGDPIIISNGTDTVTASILKIDFTAGVGYNKITVESGLLAQVTSPTSIGFCELSDATYEQSASTFTISGAGVLTIQGGLTKALDDLSGTSAALQAGVFYIEYRERISSYVNKLGILSSYADIVAKLGEPCADNPLALACYFAMVSGSNSTTYFTAVATDTVNAYNTALGFLENFDYIYSIVPCTEDVDIIKACTASVIAVSTNVESKIRRALWYGITSPVAPILYTGIGDFAAAASPNPATFTFDENVFLAQPFQEGDVIRLVASPYTEYTITGTDGVKVAYLSGSVTASTDARVELVRKSPTSADIAEAVIAMRQARTQSERAVAVWADGAIFNGEAISNFALAAAAAGMRAGEAPHRPLSNLGYAFFSLANTHGFTRSELKQIGANGVWIIAENNDGTPVNMRQITTAVANNLNKDEESIISNADTIALSCSHIGENLVGNSNISPELLEVLEDMLRTLLDSYLINTTGSIYIGPQLLEWELVSLYQDTVNLDRVYAEFDVTPPKPFNKFHMAMRVI